MSFFSAIALLFKHAPSASQVSSVEKIAEGFKTFIELLETELPEAEGKEELLTAAHDLSVHAAEVLTAHVEDSKPIPQI